MDLQQIEQLVEKYFEGITSREEEKMLHQYFNKKEVAPHLEVYKGMFNYFAEAKKDTTEREIILPETKTNGFRFKRSWYSVAAFFVIALGVALFFNRESNAVKIEQEQEALAAYKATKEALDFISLQFNESSQNLAYIHEFGESTNKLFK